jgi:hypothetical protein
VMVNRAQWSYFGAQQACQGVQERGFSLSRPLSGGRVVNSRGSRYETRGLVSSKRAQKGEMGARGSSCEGCEDGGGNDAWGQVRATKTPNSGGQTLGAQADGTADVVHRPWKMQLWR